MENTSDLEQDLIPKPRFPKGWLMFPLKHKDKTPLIPLGHNAASQDIETIEEWSKKYPGCNWGVRTGALSGVFVLDIDNKPGKFNGFDSLQDIIEELPETFQVKTGSGGLHLYYKYPVNFTGKIKTTVNWKPGIDIRGDGGYVVWAGSTHPNGNKYEYFSGDDQEISEAPEWLLKELQEKPKTTQVALVGEYGEVGEGGRNHYMTRVAGQLQRNNLLTFEALQAVNERDCNPPLEDKELEVIFNSISRYIPERPISLEMSQSVSLTKSYQYLTNGNGNNRLAVTEGLVVKASELSTQMVEFLADKDKVKGEPTLLTGLDDLLGGGHRLGEVTAWHAEAKTGKNTLWHKLMHLWLSRKAGAIPMAYASRELTPETEVLPDLLSIHLQKNVRLLDVPKTQYISIIKDWPLYFAAGYGHFPFDEIVKWVLACKEMGVQYYFFDHLHYMLEDPEDHKIASRLIKDIKSLAKTENINVQIIIQPNKLMDGQKLSLNSIKGGAAMGQAIDNLIILERLRCGTPNIMMLKTHAVRSKLAKSGTIYLQYNPQTIDMIEVEPEELDTEANRGPTFGTNEE